MHVTTLTSHTHTHQDMQVKEVRAGALHQGGGHSFQWVPGAVVEMDCKNVRITCVRTSVSKVRSPSLNLSLIYEHNPGSPPSPLAQGLLHIKPAWMALLVLVHAFLVHTAYTPHQYTPLWHGKQHVKRARTCKKRPQETVRWLHVAKHKAIPATCWACGTAHTLQHNTTSCPHHKLGLLTHNVMFTSKFKLHLFAKNDSFYQLFLKFVTVHKLQY